VRAKYRSWLSLTVSRIWLSWLTITDSHDPIEVLGPES
jgi:hypothetical protein